MKVSTLLNQIEVKKIYLDNTSKVPKLANKSKETKKVKLEVPLEDKK